MKFKSPLLAVADMAASVDFYRRVLGLRVVMDFGANVTLAGGVCLQTLDTWRDFLDGRPVAFGGNSGELYFEEDDFDAFAARLGGLPVEYVHPVREHRWGQRVVRFYDPDRNIIEVGENMKSVCRRFLDGGMTEEQAASRMDVPLKFVRACRGESGPADRSCAEASPKESSYRQLIDRVRRDYLAGQDTPGGLKWCDDCCEINLWAYWQGRGHLDARIMLVGQDWGSPWDVSSAAVMDNVRDIEAGGASSYMDGNGSATDRNLVRLFRALGYSIDRDEAKNGDLFFTNFVLGYREKGSSGGFQERWAAHDAPYFAELAGIIEPEIILCLGRSVFENVVRSFGLAPPRIDRYNDFIEGTRNPVVLRAGNGREIRVYALAHCGALGTMNRNRGCVETGDPLRRQLDDWRKIRALPERS